MTVELMKLDEDSSRIYNLIVQRFLAIFFPPAEYNTVRVETEIAKEIFITNSNIENIIKDVFIKIFFSIKFTFHKFILIRKV